MASYWDKKAEEKADLIVLDISKRLAKGNFTPETVQLQLTSIGKDHLKFSHIQRMVYACRRGKSRNIGLGRRYFRVRLVLRDWQKTVDEFHLVQPPLLRATNKLIKRAFPKSSKAQRRRLAADILAALKKSLKKIGGGS